MKLVLFTLAGAGAALAIGCSSLERSRDLGDPRVPAQTIAQQVCSSCHGMTGNTVSPNFPNLAGQTKTYLTAQLKEFKSHSRQDPAGFEYMWGLTRSLTEAQIEGLADYYAHQRPEPQPVQGPASRMDAGRQIFEKGIAAKNTPACTACHGEQGQGNEAFPRIAGQHLGYLVKQLTVFQLTNQRPDGAIMQTVAHGLTRDDIDNVATYIQALPSASR